MKYVNKKTVVMINLISLSLTGGKPTDIPNIRAGQSLGFIDRIHINEMFGQPIYPDIFHQAAAYLFYIVKNHVFYDGNKRTGLATAITFLEMNGKQFEPWSQDEQDAVYKFVISVAEGANAPDTVIPRIADWLKTMSQY